MNHPKDWDIPAIVQAVIDDDPDAAQIADSLARSLADIKAGKFARKTTIVLSAVAETRHKAGLSQRQFAETIGISVNTLKSWEQGQRKPSGAAEALLTLLGNHPELIVELRHA